MVLAVDKRGRNALKRVQMGDTDGRRARAEAALYSRIRSSRSKGDYTMSVPMPLSLEQSAVFIGYLVFRRSV
jgi:hypothetical protein